MARIIFSEVELKRLISSKTKSFLTLEQLDIDMVKLSIGISVLKKSILVKLSSCNSGVIVVDVAPSTVFSALAEFVNYPGIVNKCDGRIEINTAILLKDHAKNICIEEVIITVEGIEVDVLLSL